MKAVILAGGLGTRLAPYTTVLPKSLMPLGNCPLLEVIIRQLRAHEFTDIWLAVGYLSHLLEAYFGDGERFGVRIRYSFEEQPLGTAGPLTLIPGLDEPFLTMNGDVLTDLDYGELYRYHAAQGAALTVSMFSKKIKIDLGVLELNAASEVTDYIEKPTFAYPVSMGIYMFSPQVVRLLPRQKRVNLPDVVHLLLDRGEKVAGYLFKGQWLDIGRPEDYAQAQSLCREAEAAYSMPFAVPAPEGAAVAGAAGR